METWSISMRGGLEVSPELAEMMGMDLPTGFNITARSSSGKELDLFTIDAEMEDLSSTAWEAIEVMGNTVAEKGVDPVVAAQVALDILDAEGVKYTVGQMERDNADVRRVRHLFGGGK